MPEAEKSLANRVDDGPGPKVVSPSTRVSVAFPFSHLHIEESSKEVTELAAIVAKLISSVGEFAPNPELEGLRKEVGALLARLQR